MQFPSSSYVATAKSVTVYSDDGKAERVHLKPGLEPGEWPAALLEPLLSVRSLTQREVIELRQEQAQEHADGLVLAMAGCVDDQKASAQVLRKAGIAKLEAAVFPQVVRHFIDVRRDAKAKQNEHEALNLACRLGRALGLALELPRNLDRLEAMEVHFGQLARELERAEPGLSRFVHYVHVSALEMPGQAEPEQDLAWLREHVWGPASRCRDPSHQSMLLHAYFRIAYIVYTYTDCVMDRVLSRAFLKQLSNGRQDYADAIWAFASHRLTRVDADCLADVVMAVASLPGGEGTMTAHRAVFACIKQPMPPMRIEALYSAWIKGRLVAYAGTTPARTTEQLKEAFTRFSKEALAFGKARGLDPESPILKASLGAVGAVLDAQTLAQWATECGLPRATTAAERADAKR